MHMVQIEFTCTGSSAVFGNFATGDRLRCSAAHAAHFVEQAMCAKYVQAPAAKAPPPEPPAQAAQAAAPQPRARRATAKPADPAPQASETLL